MIKIDTIEITRNDVTLIEDENNIFWLFDKEMEQLPMCVRCDDDITAKYFRQFLEGIPNEDNS